MALLDQQCANRVATGAAVGGALGGAIGTPSLMLVGCELMVAFTMHQ